MRYGVKQDSKKFGEARDTLDWLYHSMPETKGCKEHIGKPKEQGGCGAWCCETQNPSLWYVEFLNTWNYVVHNWTDDEVVRLIERALRTYIFASNTKGCVFWDRDSKLCMQHETRPYNCRTYGIEPQEEFNARLVKLKVLYPDAREQCNLVSTVDGRPVTPKQTKKWWTRLRSVEAGIGVKMSDMHDGVGGSYRTYHDHILLHLFDDNLMSHLYEIRIGGDPMQKESCIRNVLQTMRDYAAQKAEERKANNGKVYDPASADSCA